LAGKTKETNSLAGHRAELVSRPRLLNTDLRVVRPGGPSSPPFRRTRDEFCTVWELGSVTLQRIGFFCFPIKHSTRVTTPRLRVARPVEAGFWPLWMTPLPRPYSHKSQVTRPGGVRVRLPFGARGTSSVRYGTRIGDLTENWFLLFSN